jgi:macrolide-specific efflux system membrane fusion protein
LKNKIRLLWIIPLILAVSVALIYFRGTGVDTAKPKIGPVLEAVYGLGTVVAPHTYQLKTGVNLVLKKIFFKEGDRVPRGARLVQFDESSETRAPFNGIVTSLPFKEGENIFPQIPVVTLVSLEDLYMEVSLEQQAVLRVRRGQAARVTFESLQSQRFDGKVTSVFPKDNQFIVRIDLDQFPQGALPGMTADTAIEIGRRENALSVPVRAIADGKVTVLRTGHRKKIPVQIGIVDGQWAEVVSGDIKPEDELLLRSH